MVTLAGIANEVGLGTRPISARAVFQRLGAKSLRAAMASNIAAQEIRGKYAQIGGRQSSLGRAIVSDLVVHSDGQGFFNDYRGGRINFTSGGERLPS